VGGGRGVIKRTLHETSAGGAKKFVPEGPLLIPPMRTSPQRR